MAIDGAALTTLTAWLPPNETAERPQMQLCTVDESGHPDARTVLLSSWDAEGFAFHTDAASRKVAHLRARPEVALVMLWPGFTRQITVQGTAEVLDAHALAEAYAARSPYLQQLAWQNTTELAQLEAAERAAQWAAFDRSDPLVAPKTWTGYLVRPSRLTFWESDPAGPSHRTEHRRGADGWAVHHLAG